MLKTTIRRICQALVLAAGAAAFSAAPAHADPFEILSNRYLQLTQNYDDLLWTITRVDGDPLTPSDDGLPVLFQDTTQQDLPPVQATLVVSGPTAPTGAGGFAQYRFGTNDGGAVVVQSPTRSPDGRSIISAWQIPPDPAADPSRNIIVTLKLSLVRDLVRAEYRIDNRGNARNIALRLAADPAPDPTDTGPYSPTFVPRLGFFTNETDFGAQFQPQRAGRQWLQPVSKLFQFFPVDPNPYSITMQQIRGLDATPPDRIVLAGYDPLIGGAGPPLGGAGLRDINGRIVTTGLNFYDYAINAARYILGSLAQGGDPVWGVYYGPRSLGGGRNQSVVTYYGVGVADHALARPRGGFDPSRPPAIAGEELFVGAVQTPISIPLIAGIAGNAPDATGQFGTFPLDAYAMNLRNDLVIPGVVAQLGLPVGLDLIADPALPQADSIDLGNLEPYGTAGLDEKLASWTIRVNGERAGVLPVNVSFDSPLGTAAVRREVNVPQGILYVFEDTFRMFTFPFRFIDANPNNAFVRVDTGLPLSPADYQIFRWNPVGGGGAGAYEATTELVPGQSYWIRLVGAEPKVTIRLQGATPINIPGSGIGPGGSFSTQLAAFWNMVGNPSPYAVLLKDVRFQDLTTGQVLDFDNAVRAGFMNGSVWRFDRFTGQYVPVGMWDYVQPGEGVWMFASRPVTVLWPAPRDLFIQVS